MTKDELFDFTPEDVDEDIDDVDEDDEDIDEEPLPDVALNAAAPEEPAFQPPEDTRTPEEKIADLLKSMNPHKKTLLDIMAFCVEPQPADDVAAMVDAAQATHLSVFNAPVLCRHLEAAGAIELVNENGTPFVEGEAEPIVVVEDGVEYLQAAPAPIPFWVLTDAGKTILADNDPLKAIRALFEAEPEFIPVHKLVMENCAREGGIATPDLEAIIDPLPLLDTFKPRRYTARFTSKLREVGAITFDETWKITPEGSSILAEL
ncbi:MAG: hypothetical protein IKD70_02595 [Eggerthellaceae bacterium]|nr:hypothetical protein [Eggerthellaceae bacterium]